MVKQPQLQLQPQPQTRPDYASLLSEFLEDTGPPNAESGPTIGGGTNAPSHYDGWETDHAQFQRFYVTGFGWLDSACTKHEVSFLCDYKDKIVSVTENTNWHDFVANWKDGLACKQIRRVKKFRKPIFFHKAALIIATAELALANQIAKGKAAKGISDALLVYRHMKIKPAVWNINDLNLAHITALGSQRVRQLADEVGQSVALLEDLAKGHTVTRATADQIKAANDRLFPDNILGRVRPRPGRKLGQLHASENEIISLV